MLNQLIRKLALLNAAKHSRGGEELQFSLGHSPEPVQSGSKRSVRAERGPP